MNGFIVIITITGIIAFIGYQLYDTYRIERDGVLIKTKIEFIKYIGGNDGGSTNIAFILRANIDGKEVMLKGTEAIPTFYSSQLMPGNYINIKYVDDKHFSFVFKKHAE